jgi:hypothetical protein
LKGGAYAAQVADGHGARVGVGSAGPHGLIGGNDEVVVGQGDQVVEFRERHLHRLVPTGDALLVWWGKIEDQSPRHSK